MSSNKGFCTSNKGFVRVIKAFRGHFDFSFQNVTINFYNNTARLSGAAVYASDMQLCSWLGPQLTTDQSIIFNYPDNVTVTPPFHYRCVEGIIGTVKSV